MNKEINENLEELQESYTEVSEKIKYLLNEKAKLEDELEEIENDIEYWKKVKTEISKKIPKLKKKEEGG